MVNGSFVCLDGHCIAKHKVLSINQASALAIELAGLAQVLFGTTFPCFDPKPTNLQNLPLHSVQESQIGLLFDGSNTL